VDLGYDYFLAKFEAKEDLDHVLSDGPWFIGQHFLAIKPWQPEFSASDANLSQVAVWVRLPGLPIEYYDTVVLKKIGSSIGPVLRIDSHTAANAKGRYARLCVQVNLEKPLKTTVLIGKYKQQVMYEGIHSLCFTCGRLGHKKEVCQYEIKGPQQPTTSAPADASTDQGDHPTVTPDATTTPPHSTTPPPAELDTFGPWTLVSRRKHNAKKSPQPANPSHQPTASTTYAASKHGKPLPWVTSNEVMYTDVDSSIGKGKRK